jgi:hypothetical protein
MTASIYIYSAGLEEVGRYAFLEVTQQCQDGTSHPVNDEYDLEAIVANENSLGC